MEISLTILLVVIFCLAAGSILGYTARQTIAKKQLGTAEGKAAKVTDDAEKKSQEILIEAKNKAVTILEEAKRKEADRESQILRLEERLEKREINLDQKMEEIDRGRLILEKKAAEVKQAKKDVEETRRQELKRLEKIAGLSKEEAKKVLLQLTEEENRELIARKIKSMEADGREEMEKKAKDLMTGIIQRYAGTHAAEITTSTVSIPSDEVKGRIIGRKEGISKPWNGSLALRSLWTIRRKPLLFPVSIRCGAKLPR